jgi:hypothetical protein
MRSLLQLVYEFPPAESPPARCVDYDVRWATPPLVDSLFADDTVRRRRFHDFLRRGYQGCLLVDGTRWASYAWMTRPGTGGPPHLPRSVRSTPACWIMGCRTHADYRRQGLYQASLIQLVLAARGSLPCEPVLIDTAPDNTASRAGILAAGFVPKGVVRLRRIWIPKLWSASWGTWSPTEEHPVGRLERRAA